MAVQLREVRCQWEGCGRIFYLCQHCDRGQRYCSEVCRNHGRQRSLHLARTKYAQTDSGRQKNLERQRRFYRRKVLKRLDFEKNLTDQSSQDEIDMISMGQEGKDGGIDMFSGKAISQLRAMESYRRGDLLLGARFFYEPRCLCCGRRGIVVQSVTRRGRFRWAYG